MATIRYLDTVDQSTVRYLLANGSGTELDPYVPIRDVAQDPLTFVETALTAPSTGTTGRDGRGYQYLQFLLSVSAINSSVTVRPEVSPNNTDWYPLGENYSIYANGSDSLIFAYPQPLQYVRLFFVSESGGTNAIIDVTTVLQ